MTSHLPRFSFSAVLSTVATVGFPARGKLPVLGATKKKNPVLNTLSKVTQSKQTYNCIQSGIYSSIRVYQ